MAESLYERYCRIRDNAGYKDADVAIGAKITKSTFSDWKNGRYTPKQQKLQKIADFLQVSLDYLMIGKEEPEEKGSILTAKDERDIEKKLTETLNQLESGDGLMFSGEVMDEETKRLLEISLRSTLESAKITAKKFTPKKYRK